MIIHPYFNATFKNKDLPTYSFRHYYGSHAARMDYLCLKLNSVGVLCTSFYFPPPPELTPISVINLPSGYSCAPHLPHRPCHMRIAPL